MFCPRCGQQQVVDEVRFCARCGFTLGFVSELLANNGMMPSHLVPDNPLARELTPRRRGLRAGGRMMFVGAALVPIFALFVAMTGFQPEVILTGLIIFIAGLARLLYAAIFEEGQTAARPVALSPPAHQAAPLFQPAQSHTQLPQHRPPTPASFRRADTAELSAPPASVTENTTRLLDKQADDANR
jgi:hypothetical protein